MDLPTLQPQCQPQRLATPTCDYGMTKFTQLNTGAKIPIISFGTYKLPANATTSSVVYSALKTGYRSIDTAKLYRNEKEVGEGINMWLEESIENRRDDLFIIGKLWCTDHGRVREALDETLARLGSGVRGYIDLYLMHWPVALNPEGNHPVFPTVSASSSLSESCTILKPKKSKSDHRCRSCKPSLMEPDLVPDHSFLTTYISLANLPSSLCRSVGISNFSYSNLATLLALTDENSLPVPSVLQNEIHPLNPPSRKLVHLCKQRGIVLQAYSPLGGSQSNIWRTLMAADVVKEVAQKHGCSTGRVLFGYCQFKGCRSVVVKAGKPEHMVDNLEGWIHLEKEEGDRVEEWFKQQEAKKGSRNGWRRRVVKGRWGSLKLWDDTSDEGNTKQENE